MIETILYTAAVLLSGFLVLSFILACKYGWVKKEEKIDIQALKELEEQQLNDAFNNK